MSESNMPPMQNSEFQANQISSAIPQYSNGTAAVALISGLLGFLMISLGIIICPYCQHAGAVLILWMLGLLIVPLGILAITLGAIGMSKAKKRANALLLIKQWDFAANTGKGLAIVGLILGIITVILIPMMCAVAVPALC